ncbi:MAG TPA: NgoBV family restriction endonuclease [Bacteroidetes bacterium]|nr:NgoBV family restriction endonuclease [Bacteroidota bacterium]
MITAQQLFEKLTKGYKLVGQTGAITFTLKDLSIDVDTKDSVGNLIQAWLKEWMISENIDCEPNPNSQTFPDFYLNANDKKKGLLEIKTFDRQRGPGFDLANFDSYCNSLLTDAYRIDSDYLIISYKMNKSVITIDNIWLKKIWEISGPSGPYPIKVQAKKDVIYNLRPVTWYSQKSIFKPFNDKIDFLKAIDNTRYQYPQTRFSNAQWLKNVIKNYQHHTGTLLNI